MSKLVNILSDLQGKKVKIDNRIQIITIEFSYNLKRNSNTVQLVFSHIDNAPLGKRLTMTGYIFGCGKTLNDALYFLFNEPSAKELTTKQQRVIDNIIKKNNKNK